MAAYMCRAYFPSCLNSGFIFIRLPYTVTETNKRVLEMVCCRYLNSSVPLNAKVYKSKPVSTLLKNSRPANDRNQWRNTEKSGRKKKFILAGGALEMDADTFNKMSEEEGDDDFNYSENYQDVLQNTELYYDMHFAEMRAKRSLICKKIIEKKCFKSDPEPSLLTWAAKKQIQYLHRLDPEEWNPETIVQYFPISLPGVKKLLRHKVFQVSRQIIENYDQLVAQTWKKLARGDTGNIHESLLKKWQEGRLCVSNSLPNPAFPVPPPENPNPSIFLEDPNKAPGEFLSLVKPYVDMQKRTLEEKSKDSDLQLTPQINFKSPNSTMFKNNMRPFVDDEEDDVDERMVERFRNRQSNHVTQEQFIDNMKRRLKARPTDEGDAMLSWMTNRTSGQYVEPGEDEPLNIQKTYPQNKVGKYKGVEIRYETRKDITFPNQEAAYMYTPKTGYQHPLGKETVDEEKIVINKSMVKEGNCYKHNNCYYSADGDFLYKVY